MTPVVASIDRLLGKSRQTPRRPLDLVADHRSRTDKYGRRDLVFAGDGGESFAAILTHPLAAPPWPAVLYCHAHGNRYATGSAELVEGRPALQSLPYGEALAAIGCAALCLDMPCFGSRQAEAESARAKRLLWQGDTLFGRMLADLTGGIDFLVGQPDIYSDRVAALGLSMGATHAFWLGALDRRVAAVVQLCVFADLETLIASGAHDLHGLYMTVPGLTGLARTGDIAGLCAPRPQFVGVGLADPLTPAPAFRRAEADLASHYARAGAAERLTLHIEPDGGHRETAAMRRAVLTFLQRWL